MPNVYTGDPTTVAPADATEITEPVDGDGLNVASVNTALEKLADFVAILRKGYQTSDVDAQFQTTAAPVGDYKLLWKIEGAAGGDVRLYSVVGGLVITTNAEYVGNLGAEWARDVNASSTRIEQEGGEIRWSYYSGGATWAIADWVSWLERTSTTTEIPTGDLTVTVGNVTASAGNITASDGNVEAAGDPASNEARIKGKQFISTASTPTAGGGQVVAGVGQAAAPDNTKVVITGTDLGGTIQVAAEAGAIAGIVATITFTKAFPNGSAVVLTPADASTGALAPQPHVGSSSTNWTITTQGAGALVAGTTYNWKFAVASW